MEVVDDQVTNLHGVAKKWQRIFQESQVSYSTRINLVLMGFYIHL
jgi:hypothetical protein